jgi:hypothetical protein
MSITQWFSDAFNGRIGGLTDKQYTAQQEKTLRSKQGADAKIVAKRAATAEQRAATTARTVAVNAEYETARNTRVDKLTPRQRALIKAGHSLVNTPTATWDDSPAQEKPVRSAKKNTGSSTNSAKSPVKPEFPKPSMETQPPAVEGFADKRSRVSVIGSDSPQLFDINSFRSEIINEDVLPSHSYLVTFSPFRAGFPENQPLTRFVQNKRNTLVMRCESIILPTPSLLEEENIRRYGYGPVEKIPYGVQFSDVAITWLVDKRSEIIDFMHQWMNTIVSHDSPNANMETTQGIREGLDGYSPFEVGYKDGYANPIVRIYVYNRQNETVTEYELFDVFPMNIQSMNLGWADENQLQKLTVNFAYTNMRMKAPQKTSIKQLNSYYEGTKNPNEETTQPDDRGGKAAADAAGSPVDEVITGTANASKPNATEYRYFNAIIDDFGNVVEVPTPVIPTPVTRELTST